MRRLQVGTTAAISKAITLVEASGGDAQLAAAVLDHLNTAPVAAPQSRPATSGSAAAGGGTGASAGGGGGSSGGAISAAAGEVGIEELRFRLHMALGRLAEAARSALEDARREQVIGTAAP
jgi:hypothetical protein